VHTYAYDGENRLVQADGGTTAGYGYDGAGLRVRRTVGPDTTRYIYSGTQVLAEYLNGSFASEYVYAGDQLLATIAGAATTYHHRDHLSVRLNTAAAGAVAGTQGHYPFGETWYGSGEATKWAFTTYERDAETSLGHATFRFDSPRLGRFVTSDPLEAVGDPQSHHRYAYARNDPVNLRDPLGLHWDQDCYEACVRAGGGDWNCETYCEAVWIPDPSPFLGLGEPQPRGGATTPSPTPASVIHGGAGGSSGGTAQKDPCSRYGVQVASAFVQQHWGEAQELAAALGTDIANVLTLSGVESGWGRDKVAVLAHNFFGLKAGSPYTVPPHKMLIRNTWQAVFPKQNGYWISGLSFLASKRGGERAHGKATFEDFFSQLTPGGPSSPNYALWFNPNQDAYSKRYLPPHALTLDTLRCLGKIP
jgi:RHS repeat-associated protein